MAKKKHPYKHSHISHHADGSATVKHEHEDGVSHSEHAVENIDGIHDSLESHLGEPNEGEGETAATPGAAPAAVTPGAAPAAVTPMPGQGA